MDTEQADFIREFLREDAMRLQGVLTTSPRKLTKRQTVALSETKRLVQDGIELDRRMDIMLKVSGGVLAIVLAVSLAYVLSWIFPEVHANLGGIFNAAATAVAVAIAVVYHSSAGMLTFTKEASPPDPHDLRPSAIARTTSFAPANKGGEKQALATERYPVGMVFPDDSDEESDAASPAAPPRPKTKMKAKAKTRVQTQTQTQTQTQEASLPSNPLHPSGLRRRRGSSTASQAGNS